MRWGRWLGLLSLPNFSVPPSLPPSGDSSGNRQEMASEIVHSSKLLAPFHSTTWGGGRGGPLCFLRCTPTPTIAPFLGSTCLRGPSGWGRGQV